VLPHPIRSAVLPTPHISVIDDDDSVREAMKNLVDMLGYSVDVFASAEAFLASSRVNSTACVIADVQMPGMSGVELHRRLLAGGRPVPVIFVTAYPNESIRDRVMRDGAIGYLSKPLQKRSLLDCLDRALSSGAG
jgi:FixJ family two-component response regulator